MTRAEALRWGRGLRRRVDARDIPAAVLALVDERQGGRFCVACRELGLVTPASVPLELDHLQPLSQGGDHHHLNLAWRCRSHNRGRGARSAAPRATRPAWARRAT